MPPKTPDRLHAARLCSRWYPTGASSQKVDTHRADYVYLARLCSISYPTGTSLQKLPLTPPTTFVSLNCEVVRLQSKRSKIPESRAVSCPCLNQLRPVAQTLHVNQQMLLKFYLSSTTIVHLAFHFRNATKHSQSQ